MLSNKSLILLAVLSSVAFSSCGKKKELSSGTAQPEASQPTPQGPTPRGESRHSNDPDNNKKSEERPSTPDVKPAPPVPVPPRQEPGDKNPPAQEGQQPPRYNEEPQAQQPQDQDPAKVNFDSTEGRRLTGMKSNKGDLFYTGSSTDNLLEYFKDLEKNKSRAQKDLNLKRAASVNSAQVEIDSYSGEVLLTLKTTTRETYVLAGSPDGEIKSNLRLVRSRSTGRDLVSGFHKCVDLDGRCQTSYARLKFSDGSTMRVIFRKTIADYHFKLPSQDSGSPEYVYWEKFIINGAKGTDTPYRLGNIYMNTYEVVNGRSAMQVKMEGLDRNLIAFSGPLLAPEAGTAVNELMSRRLSKADSDDLMGSEPEYKYEYANMVEEIRLRNNNGRGQVRVAIKLRKRSNQPQDVLLLTLSRVSNAVMTANDVAEFERRN